MEKNKRFDKRAHKVNSSVLVNESIEMSMCNLAKLLIKIHINNKNEKGIYTNTKQNN